MVKKIISINQKNFNLEEIKEKIPSNYLLIFFCPVENIESVGKALSSHYTNSIGCSSYYDITKDYSDYNSLSILGIEIKECKFCMVKDVNKKVITYYKEIQELKKIYKKGHSVLLEFTDGLSLSEESLLTVTSNELGDIPLIGGSAADNGSFTKTLVCINGECCTNAAALCMLTTDMEIEVFCENIYRPTKIKGIITDSEVFQRKINTINKIPATDFYCKELNISKDNIESQFTAHPLARIIGDNYFITSIMGVENNSFNVYCRSFKQSYISICDPINYTELWSTNIKNQKTNYLGGIFINCIFRTQLFQKDNTLNKFQNYLSSYGDFICMTSYGEQYCDSHANQTMTYCLFK